MLRTSLSIIIISLLAVSASAQTAADKYVKLYKEAAVRTMNQHGVPASIILGVAIHESASGTSKIAKYLNNHFGLKGKTGPKPIASSYKGYENVEDCYLDFVSYLKRSVNNLFEKYPAGNYQKWALGIQRGGYAASHSWASQVMGIIKKYKLYEYDGTIPESIRPLPVVESASIGSDLGMVSYQVKNGDTLGKIAKEYNTTVNSIISKNKLKTSHLHVGQVLHL